MPDAPMTPTAGPAASPVPEAVLAGADALSRTFDFSECHHSRLLATGERPKPLKIGHAIK